MMMAKNVWLESLRSLVGSVHSMSWDLLSSLYFDSVNPRGAVEEPVIECCLGKQGKREAGEDF